MSVKLRKRKNKDGTTSIVMDIYHNGKRNFEFLKELKLFKANSPVEREENRQRWKLAEQIRNKKEQLLQSNEYDIVPDFKKGIDFVQFFSQYVDSYTKKDKRIFVACLHKFKSFMQERGIESLTTKNVNESLVIEFKGFLESSLNGVSPSNYFRKFKKVLRQGVREKIFAKNPAEDITIKRGESITKDILTFDEIQKLAKAPLVNTEVKRAFLFSCVSGLRYCDVKNLKWNNISGHYLKIIQQKTERPVSINLNKNAVEILGRPGKREENIFHLPSHTACLKNLRSWCKKAGIEKKITWHCARHSFATNIIFYGSDVNSASALLGHTSLTYTQRYVRIVESLKEKAVQNLPEIDLAI